MAIGRQYHQRHAHIYERPIDAIYYGASLSQVTAL